MKYMFLVLPILVFAQLVLAGDTYKVDPVHTSVVFRVGHAGIGIIYGRFNDAAGEIVLDDLDPTQSSFNIQVQSASVDTHNEKRDAHLKSPDFLNAKQYPAVTFKSTAVKKVDETHLEVTGDFTLHGVTKAITVPVAITGKGEFPKGTKRVGIETNFTIKQSDYQIKGVPGGTSDEIRLMVAMESTR